MKRLFALFVAATLTLSAAFNAYADDKGLADAITAAKQYITVPADRTEIDYNITNGENGAVIINLSWSNDNGSTDVTLDKDGCLLNYNDYENDRERSKGLSKYTGEQTKAKADEFLRVVYGSADADFRLEKSTLNRSYHTYQYNLYKNNIRVTTANARISVDPDTGKITSYDGTGKEFLSLKYPAPSGIINTKQAMTAFYDGELPKPVYRIYNNYDRKKVTKTPFLAFSVRDTYKAVNAFSGNTTSINRYFNEYAAKGASNDMAAESAADDDNGFTPQELEAIEHAEGLISSQRAAEIIKQNFTIAKNVNFTASNINKSYYSDEYLINIRGNNANATLNAKTGKIISFNYYNNTFNPARKELSDEEISDAEKSAEPKAKAIIEKLAPAESKKLSKPALYTSRYDGEVDVTYNRIEYGYECEDNSISVSVNADGDIVSYYNRFDEKLIFPHPTNVFSGDKAVEALADLFDFELCYTVDESYKVDLVYSFNKTGLMSASSKTLINYKGEPQAEEVESGISDVKGHWCESIVTTLYNNGYKLNDELFRPDQPITRKELDTLYNNYSYKPYYIYEDDAESAEDNSTITRYELAEYIMEYYNLDKLKNHPDIFNITSYKDTIDEKYVPAVAIATALGAMRGDNMDNFNGNKEVTRAEAAAALYNMLTAEE